MTKRWQSFYLVNKKNKNGSCSVGSPATWSCDRAKEMQILSCSSSPLQLTKNEPEEAIKFKAIFF